MSQELDEISIPQFESAESLERLFNNVFENSEELEATGYWYLKVFESKYTNESEEINSFKQRFSDRILRDHGLSRDLRIGKRIYLVNQYNTEDREGFGGVDVVYNLARKGLDKQFGEHKHSIGNTEYWVVREGNFLYLITLELTSGVRHPGEEFGTHVALNLYQLYFFR